MPSPQEQKLYCDNHKESYQIEPIVKRAYEMGFLHTEIMYTHLKIAELHENPNLTWQQLASELQTTPRALTVYEIAKESKVTKAEKLNKAIMKLPKLHI